jgi:hypothetical protein
MKKLTLAEQTELLLVLNNRFRKHTHRHAGVSWEEIEKKIQADEKVVWSLSEMEQTGGEPDVICFDGNTYGFVDCAKETPKDRRSLCYDRQALEARKKFAPVGTAMDMAADMGIELLTEQEYKTLQKLGEFDTVTSSWIKTPDKIRSLGGALFCDRRYDTVFVYHNGADSYYASRGFRGKLLLSLTMFSK